MSDKFLKALQTYLKGDEWKDSIELFVNSNCKDFSTIDEMTHYQFGLWKNFQEIVENILQVAMEYVGGTIDSLERELSIIVKNTEARGPRDARILDVIERLLSFDDFYAFAVMMNKAYLEQNEVVHPFTNKDVDLSVKNGKSFKSIKTAKSYYQPIKSSTSDAIPEEDAEYEARVQKMYEENYYALYQMGYTDDDIYAVMGVNSHDLTLDEWITKLNSYIEERNQSYYTGTTNESYDNSYSSADNGQYASTPGEEVQEDEADDNENDEEDNEDDGESKRSEDMLTESRKEKYHEEEANLAAKSEDEEEQWEDPSQFDNQPFDQKASALLKETMKLKPVIVAFIRESSGVISDGSEFNAKFALAESIKDTFDVVTNDTSDGMKKMIQWAGNMLVLRKDMDTAHRNGIPFKAYDVHYNNGLIEWYSQLEANRKDIDEATVGGNIISDSEIKRMIELDKIAMLGSEDEQYLHSLFTRHDTVTRDVKNIYFKINVLVNNDRHITRAHIEELYVYLKKQVANNSNLDDIADDLFEFVASRISSAKNSEVLTLLLDLHLLEDEEEMLKKKIQALAGGEPEPSTPSQSGKNSSPTGLNQETLEAGVNRMRLFSGDGDEFPEAKSLSTKADAKYGGETARGEKGYYKNYESKQLNSISDISSVSSFASSTMLSADGKSHAGFGSELDWKQSQMSLLDHKQSGMSFISTMGSQSYDASHNEAYLNSLKDKHKSSLFNLKNSLEAEKQRKMKELEEKLAKRRQKIKQLTADGEPLDPEQQNLLELQQNELLVISDQMTETSNKYNSMITNMVSGYRKKCLAELKLAKKNVAEGNPAGSELSADDKDSINKELTGQILSRFERDTQSLLDRIENDRVKARNKLLLKLAKKKGELQNSNSEADIKALAKLEQKTHLALEKLNTSNAEQVAQVLLDSQTNVLNTLSALNLDDSVLARSKGAREDGEEDEDDFYFDEVTSNSSGNKLGSWLERMGTIQDNYLNASKQIQFKLNYVNNNSILVQDEALFDSIKNADFDANQQNIDQLEKSTSAKANFGNSDDVLDSTYSNVTSHMMKVVVDAYSNQMHNDDGLKAIGVGNWDSNIRKNSDGEFTQSTKMVRVKAKQEDTSQIRAAIFAEFQRTKASYDNVLDVSKANSKQKLIDRRNQSRKAAAGAVTNVGSGSGPKVAVFESIVESFLEDPLVSELEYKDQVVALISPRSSASTTKVVHHSYRDANDAHDNNEDKDRIKSLHTERERVLEDDLYASMMAKKKKLEERLAKKKAQVEKAKRASENSWTGGEDDAITAVALKRQEQEAKDKIVALEKAFENIQSMLQSATKEELKQFDLKTLVNLMEQKPIVGQNPLMDLTSPSAKGNGLNTVREDEEVASYHSESIPSTSRSHSALPPIVVVDKTELEAQARRISCSYSEENQKQDLMMKIKETRQRQKLQRKLLEKKQSHASNTSSVV